MNNKEILNDNKTNILPCPFCGYNHISFLTDEYDNPVYPWYSQCQMCGAGAKHGKTLEDAVKEWNRRVNQPTKHGYWIDNNAIGYKWAFICSECGYVNGSPFNDRLEECPNCKTKMDGDDSNALN